MTLVFLTLLVVIVSQVQCGHLCPLLELGRPLRVVFAGQLGVEQLEEVDGEA